MIQGVSMEIRNRVRLSVAAYAYEFENTSIMTDAEFDRLCQQIDVSVTTGNEVLDKFFKKHFDKSTGMWVRSHPDIVGLKRIYNDFYK